VPAKVPLRWVLEGATPRESTLDLWHLRHLRGCGGTLGALDVPKVPRCQMFMRVREHRQPLDVSTRHSQPPLSAVFWLSTLGSRMRIRAFFI
jgi:hypothetical protein